MGSGAWSSTSKLALASVGQWWGRETTPGSIVSVTLAFILNTATYLIAAGSLWGLRDLGRHSDEPAQAIDGKRVLTDLVDGLRYLSRRSSILHPLLLTFVTILVVGLAYIREELRIYFVYLGTVLIFSAYLLRFLKGVRILMNKDVLIFYLILYLCTLEILPFLILYRFFSLSVLRG